MTAAAAVVLILATQAAPEPSPSPTAPPRRGPTFCAEWIRQTPEGFERLTLFADRTLVWKTSTKDHEDVKRKELPKDETDYYCEYFARPEFWALPADLRSNLSGSFAQSRVTLTRPDGSRKAIQFDELSGFSPEGSALRASLLGLRNLFTDRLPRATSFTPKSLPPGTILRRFDGVSFRVVRVLEDKDVVELEGVTDPIFYFLRLSQMRYQFEPPP